MKHILLALILGLNACSVYKDYSSNPFSMEETFLGMDRAFIIEKYGEPFSFSIRTEEEDTVTVLSYKTPKAVAGHGFIVTTRLQFVNDTLRKISQDDFFVADNVIVFDPASVSRQEEKTHQK